VTEYLGTEYTDYVVRMQLKRFPVVFEELEDAALAERAAEMLAGHRVVGWCRGRSEFGPRALGNRSILASACGARTKDLLNGRVKRREAFRPYAAVVPLDKASRYFDLVGASPVMLRQATVLDPELPAITHVDQTSRVQTVTPVDNPALHTLLEQFGASTGKHVLLNTSLNVASEPIAETPEDAILSLLRTEMDYLVINNFCVWRR
jgi:carbamoyltransferase